MGGGLPISSPFPSGRSRGMGAPWAETRGTNPLCCSGNLPARRGAVLPRLSTRANRCLPAGSCHDSPGGALPSASFAGRRCSCRILPYGGPPRPAWMALPPQPLLPFRQVTSGRGCWGPRCWRPWGHLPWGGPGCWHPLFPRSGASASVVLGRSFLPPRSPPTPAGSGTDPGLCTVEETVWVPRSLSWRPRCPHLQPRAPGHPSAPGRAATSRDRCPRDWALRDSTGRPNPAPKLSVCFPHLFAIFRSRRSRRFGYYLARQYTVPVAFSTRGRK